MRIDAHQHFWRYDAHIMTWINQDMSVLARDYLPTDIAPQMAAEAMQAAIAVQSLDSEADTTFLMSLAQAYPWIVGVIGWTDLRATDCANRIAYWQSQGPLVGLRHLVQDCPSPRDLLEDAAFNQGLTQLQSAGLTYDLLLLAHQLHEAIEFCVQHDQHWIVIDHLGKPAIGGAATAYTDWLAAMQQFAAMPHVALKWSGLITQLPRGPNGDLDTHEVTRYLDTALKLFGSQRLLFGSDWPVCQLAGSHAQVHRLACDWSQGLSTHDQAALYGGTAHTIYAHGLRDYIPSQRPTATLS